MVLGPNIDPPVAQNSYRPAGVYHYPDARVGCEGRTIYELWAGGECLAVTSAAESVRLVLEPRLWEFVDMMTDRAPRVASLTPHSLRVLR